jgi:hypothetical protein
MRRNRIESNVWLKDCRPTSSELQRLGLHTVEELL